MAARTNRFIGGDAPSHYLNRINASKGVAPEQLDNFLGSHEVDSTRLRADDFDGFLLDRARRLLDLIEEASGKQVTGRDSEETIQAFSAALT